MKYKTEKALHEIIRDLQTARQASDAYGRGMITIEDALSRIALAIRLERIRLEEKLNRG